eukprot:s1500_g19.t1
MVLPWSFRCLLILLLLLPFAETARPVAGLQRTCPKGSSPRKDHQGCECRKQVIALAPAAVLVANFNCTTPGLHVLGFVDQEPKGCECLTRSKFALTETIPVHVAAIRFCESAVQEMRNYQRKKLQTTQKVDDEADVQDWVKDHRSGAAELCQNALANASKQVDPMNPWKSETEEPGRQGVFARFARFARKKIQKLLKQKGPEGFGRMAPVEEEATSEADRKAWRHALKHVCHDECAELVSETMTEMRQLAYHDTRVGISAPRSCATRVVQKVEAETFTCCAKACGWNNATCMSWPFLSKQQQIDWEAECCSEWNVLKGSSRQRMCNSVLSPTDTAKVSK